MTTYDLLNEKVDELAHVMESTSSVLDADTLQYILDLSVEISNLSKQALDHI